MVKHIIPTTYNEALEALNEGEHYIIAGGTDLMVMKKNTQGLPPKFDKDVVYVANLKELQKIEYQEDGLHIGAAVTLENALENEYVPKLLKDVIATVASSNIRHTGTLVGNIANASPAGDTIVAHYILDSELVLASVDGERRMLVSDFIYGVRKIMLKPNEMIKEIITPHHKFDYATWFKVGSRKAETISKVSFAGAYSLYQNKIKDIRLAFGSVFMKIVRSIEIESSLIGLTIDEIHQQIPEIIAKYGKIISPIDDQRSTKKYREQVVMNIIKEFLENIK